MGVALEKLAPVIVTAIVFLFVFLIVIASLYAAHRRRLLEHESFRIALEKGRELPPGLLSPPRPPASDLRRGLTLVGLGLGLSLFLASLETHAWGAGLIPGLLGAGYLATHFLGRRGAALEGTGEA